MPSGSRVARPATSCTPPRTSSTRRGSSACFGRRASRTGAPPGPGPSFERPSGYGPGRPSPTSPPNLRSRGRDRQARTSCGCRRSRNASRQISVRDDTARCSASSRRSPASIRCANGCGAQLMLALYRSAGRRTRWPRSNGSRRSSPTSSASILRPSSSAARADPPAGPRPRPRGRAAPRLPPARADRRGRVRHRLPRDPAPGRARGRDQGDASRAREPPRLRPAVRARGADRGPPRASARRPALRLLARARRRVPGDAIPARRQPRGPPRRRSARPGRGRRDHSIRSPRRSRPRTGRASSTAT